MKHTTEKTLEELTYNELVEMIALEAHSALLEGGGSKMKSTLFMWIGQAIKWSETQKGKKS